MKMTDIQLQYIYIYIYKFFPEEMKFVDFVGRSQRDPY